MTPSSGRAPGLDLDRDGRRLRISGPLRLNGRVRVPGDKSISHRALLFAAVADGDSSIRSLGSGADVAATRHLLRCLGVEMRSNGNEIAIRGRGFDGLSEPSTVLHCGNSGTTMRVGAGLLAGRPFFSVLTGDRSLRTRPMRRIIEPLRTMGARVSGARGDRFPPIVMRGGGLRGCDIEIDVASAQVKGCLVLAALQADGRTRIRVPGATRDHTERLLKAIGADVKARGNTVTVNPSEPSAFTMDVPGDISSAVFLIVATAVCPGSEVTIERVGVNPTRTAVIDALVEMGVDLEIGPVTEELGEPTADITVRHSPSLRAIDRSGAKIASLIDEIPAIVALGAFAEGRTTFADAGELRAKESDRISTVAEEVSRLRVGVETGKAEISVEGGSPRAAAARSHGDHRVAMAMAAALAGVAGESTVDGFDAAAVSYPEFVSDLARLAGVTPPGADSRRYAAEGDGRDA